MNDARGAVVEKVRPAGRRDWRAVFVSFRALPRPLPVIQRLSHRRLSRHIEVDDPCYGIRVVHFYARTEGRKARRPACSGLRLLLTCYARGARGGSARNGTLAHQERAGGVRARQPDAETRVPTTGFILHKRTTKLYPKKIKA